MRFSMKTEYGVRAIMELAALDGRAALQSGEIARRQRIPGPFLDQVLMTLRRAGFVRSVRGPHGGHMLARSAGEIRLDEVIACLEGPGAEPANETDGDQSYGLVLHRVTRDAEQAAKEVFAAHTLTDLLRLQAAEPPVFHGIFKPLPSRGRR
jgi:Rrf2 family protein